MAAHDIIGHQFTSENQPKNRRSRKGIPNRATVLKKSLTIEVDFQNPITEKAERGDGFDQVVLSLIQRALQSDLSAIKEIQDTL